MRLYRWNAKVTAAFWEPIGHLEVALRNTLAARSTSATRARAARFVARRFEPELSSRARVVIAPARARATHKGKCASDGQTISELSFGFWRFLVTQRLTALWPDLAGGFPHAPDRRRTTVENPIARLHDFRNRLAHHQRVWNHDLEGRRLDLMTVAGYMDLALPAWIEANGSLRRVLDDQPTGVSRRSVV